MNDSVFGFAQVIFHLVLAAVLHGSRSPQVFKTRRKQKPPRRVSKARMSPLGSAPVERPVPGNKSKN